MAAPVIVPLLTNLTLAESVTNWAAFKISGTGGGPAAALEPDLFVQGANSISTIANKQRVWLYFDQGTAGGSLDFSPGGANEGEMVYMWINFLTPGFSQTRNGGGITIAMGSSTTNYSEWYLHGSDTYASGWIRVAIDPRKPTSVDNGTGVDISAIDFIGFIGDVQGSTARFTNMYCDRIDVGTGIQITGGDGTTPASWQELLDDDDALANKYGIIQERSGVFYLTGEVKIGDESTAGDTTLWEDATGSTVVFEDQVYDDSNGNLISLIVFFQDSHPCRIACKRNRHTICRHILSILQRRNFYVYDITFRPDQIPHTFHRCPGHRRRHSDSELH